jgi:hypothetical protein
LYEENISDYCEHHRDILTVGKHVSAVKGEINLKEGQTLFTKFRKLWITICEPG